PTWLRATLSKAPRRVARGRNQIRWFHRIRSLRAEEFVPLRHQIIVLVWPLVPVSHRRGSLLERASVAQIALFDPALGRALPGLALIPEGVFVGIHRLLNVGRRRVITLFRDRDRWRAREPVVGVGD